MSSYEFDTVKAEKADAVRRFNRRRNFGYCLQLLGAFCLLCCFLGWFPSITKKVSSHLPLLHERLCALVLSNMLILVIYVLSIYNNGKNDSELKPNLYDEYVSLSTSSSRSETGVVEEKRPVFVTERETPPEKDSANDGKSEKQIVPLGINVGYDLAKDNPVRDLAVVDESHPVKNDEKRYRRSRSDMSRRDQKENRRRELRRTESLVKRELRVVNGGGRTPDRKSLHEMNSEEFRLKIESFIESTRKILLDEDMALLSKE